MLHIAQYIIMTVHILYECSCPSQVYHYSLALVYVWHWMLYFSHYLQHIECSAKRCRFNCQRVERRHKYANLFDFAKSKNWLFQNFHLWKLCLKYNKIINQFEKQTNVFMNNWCWQSWIKVLYIPVMIHPAAQCSAGIIIR